eukprot:gene56883-biopygen87648
MTVPWANLPAHQERWSQARKRNRSERVTGYKRSDVQGRLFPNWELELVHHLENVEQEEDIIRQIMLHRFAEEQGMGTRSRHNNESVAEYPDEKRCHDEPASLQQQQQQLLQQQGL